MFGLKNYFSKQISVEEFINYLRCYVDRKVSKEEFFNCDKDRRIVVSECKRFTLDKNELNFESYDFSKIDLSNFEISVKSENFKPYELNFSTANLTSITLYASILNYVNFENAKFSKSIIDCSFIKYSKLKNSIWVETKPVSSFLLRSNLENISLINSEPKPISIFNISINCINEESFRGAGTCIKLGIFFSKVLKSLKNCAIIFLRKNNIEIPIGILKFLGDESFLLIQDIEINGKIYPKGICFEIEKKLYEKVKNTEKSKIYKLILNEINLQTLIILNSKYIDEIFKNIDILLKKIESNEIEFEEISID